jgi:U3 small nucleolar RNA-associated protein 4
MDATIHRLRFLKLAPKSILVMASTPNYHSLSTRENQEKPDGEKPPYKPSKRQLIAISRQGGSVELIDPTSRWITVGYVPGVRGRHVDALVWVCGDIVTEHSGDNDTSAYSNSTATSTSPRLIGASRDGTLFQFDFYKQRQIHVVGSGAGGIFCLSSLCSKGYCRCHGDNDNKKCRGYFAAGCEDGTIKLYRLNVNGMELISTLPSVGHAVLSLAWVGNSTSKTCDGLGGSVMFAGVADGTIRRLDCVSTSSSSNSAKSTGMILTNSEITSTTATVHRWKPTLRMVVENRGLREATKVWTLQALSDRTVISGDSLGNVQFWDGEMGTMLQTFHQSESGADVLCLAVSEDENKVFASGVDARIVCLQRQGLASEVDAHVNNLEDTPIRKWINVCAHRKHTHDIRALVICHKTATGSKKKMEMLVSGSIDTRLCTYVTNDFRSSRPRIWFNWSSVSPISLSREHRIIAVTRSDGIDLYRLGSSNDTKGNEAKDESKCLVKSISIKSPFNLNCSTISNDGKFLAASDASALFIFSLKVQDQDGIFDLNPTKLHLPKECRRPCTALRFDDAQSLICATVDGSINILQLSSDKNNESTYNVSLEHVFKEHLIGVDPSSHNSAITCLDVSLDGKWFAITRFSHEKGSVHAFSLEPFGHWWSLPQVEATATCIKFLGEGSLAVGCSNNSFYIFNLQRRELSNWSHDMGLPIVKSLPKEYSSRKEPLARILLTPSLHQKLVLVRLELIFRPILN